MVVPTVPDPIVTILTPALTDPRAPVVPNRDPIPWAPPMDRDATFLLSLVMLAAAAIAVGVSGWVLFVRDHRAASHPPASEGS